MLKNWTLYKGIEEDKGEEYINSYIQIALAMFHDIRIRNTLNALGKPTICIYTRIKK